MPDFSSYDRGVPVSSTPPRQSPPNFHSNFEDIEDLINVDHYSFHTGTSGGYHKKSTYVAGTDPGSGGSQIVHYAKTVAGSTEEFIQRDGVVGPIQLTSGTTIITGTSLGSVGQTFLPGGLQYKWGVALVPAGGNVTVTFTTIGLTAFPANGLTGGVTSWSNGSQMNITNITQTSITIASPGGGSCLWHAIGN